jgi:hypothetical protein
MDCWSICYSKCKQWLSRCKRCRITLRYPPLTKINQKGNHPLDSLCLDRLSLRRASLYLVGVKYLHWKRLSVLRIGQQMEWVKHQDKLYWVCRVKHRWVSLLQASIVGHPGKEPILITFSQLIATSLCSNQARDNWIVLLRKVCRSKQIDLNKTNNLKAWDLTKLLKGRDL